LNVDINHSIYY